MNNAFRGLLLSIAVVTLTGCGNVAGRWTLDTIKPEEARESYPLSSLTLHGDGTYVATMPRGDELVTSQGRYEFENGQLCFENTEGEQRTYDARLVALGTKMEVKTEVDGQEVTAVMKRHYCQKCAGCEQKCSECEKHEEHEKHCEHEKHK
jgi:hypothetical protein